MEVGSVKMLASCMEICTGSGYSGGERGSAKCGLSAESEHPLIPLSGLPVEKGSVKLLIKGYIVPGYVDRALQWLNLWLYSLKSLAK